MITITPDLLRAATGCRPEQALLYALALDEACGHYRINATPARLAAFLAQLAHESGALRHVREIWGPTAQQQRYERDFGQPWPANGAEARQPPFKRNSLAWGLGNSEPGDGERFSGHALIQTTGRANHRRTTTWLRKVRNDVPDFEAEPERLTEPEWACWASAAFWAENGLNAMADAGEFDDISSLINTGRRDAVANGADDRRRLHQVARVAIGAAIGEAGASEAIDPAPIPTQPPRPQAAPWPFPRGGEADPPESMHIETEVHTEPPEPAHIPAGEAEPPERTMPLPAIIHLFGKSLIGQLAGSLAASFAPVAQEKLTREMSRHTDKPEVAEQVAAAIVNTAKKAIGVEDPIAAVVAAKADPQAVQLAQESALDTLDKMLPLLDKMVQWDKAGWEAEEASRDDATKRAADDPNDQDPYLTRAIVRIVVGLLLVTGALIGIAMWRNSTELNALIVFFTTIGGGVAAKFGTRYDHRYGSSRSNSAKDIVIGELSRRPAPRSTA